MDSSPNSVELQPLPAQAPRFSTLFSIIGHHGRDRCRRPLQLQMPTIPRRTLNLCSQQGLQQDNAVQDGEPQPECDGGPAAAERANGVDWTAKDDDRTNPETLEEMEPEAPDLQVLIGV